MSTFFIPYHNYVSIMCEDGTGIVFPGSLSLIATYGELDKDGSILESKGDILLQEDGTYLYEEK